MKRHPDQMGHTHVTRDQIPCGARLCDRHIDIWRQLVIGGSNKEIAQRTGFSYYTIKNHVAELYAVLGIQTTATNRRSRILATLWGMEMMQQHPEAFRKEQS